MPNEVYEAAVNGLGSLVSPRVAKRIVDEALRATSRTPDDVSRSAMRRLLLGRIRKELEGVMPAGAVGPGLKQLAATLEGDSRRETRPWWRRAGRDRNDGSTVQDALLDSSDERPQAVRAAPKAASATSEAAAERRASERRVAERRSSQRRGGLPAPETIGVTRSSIYLPDVPLPPEPPTTGAKGGERQLTTASVNASTVTAVAEREGQLSGNDTTAMTPQATEAPSIRPRATLPELTPRLVERAFRVFADLETVRQIVAVQRGAVLQSRGAGIDSERLQGLSVATTALLSKAGTLRVFSLEHEAGVLFLFPMKNGALVVLTQPKVNIGAVLSARAALEEAA